MQEKVIIQIHDNTIGTNNEVIVILFKSKDNGTNLIKNMSKTSEISTMAQRSISFINSENFDASDLIGTLTDKTLNYIVLSMLGDETFSVHTQIYPSGELRGQILENEG